MNTRSPGKLNVSAFGGKLNSILMNGPAGPAKPLVVPSTSRKISAEKSGNVALKPIASSATLPRRSPGKLDVGAIGGKLNNLLLAGPGNVRGPKDKAIETPDSLNSDVVLPSTETSVIGVLKNRPRGPANRRPPTRSMIMSKSDLTEVTSKVKKTVSQDEMNDPLSF